MKPDWNHIIDDDWTLFLDRDGVINRRIVGGYVTSWDSFEFLPGVMEAMEVFQQRFKHILVITNQQGIGKGLMTTKQVEAIHIQMLAEIDEHSGCHIDAVLVCPQLATAPDNFRKPNPLMAFYAQELFPDIDLKKSIMVGDGASDIEFGRNAGTMTVFIGDDCPDADDSFPSLHDFAKRLIP